MTVEFLNADDLEALAGKSAGPGTTQEATQARIVAHLQANLRATRKQPRYLLAQWLGRSDAGVKYHLAKLTKARSKRRTGTTKAGRGNLLA